MRRMKYWNIQFMRSPVSSPDGMILIPEEESEGLLQPVYMQMCIADPEWEPPLHHMSLLYTKQTPANAMSLS